MSLALQDKVTRKIVAALVGKLTPDERAPLPGGVNLSQAATYLMTPLSRKETVIPAAYDALLRGLAHYRRRTPEHWVKALGYFQKSVELDPNYSRAYAALASLYWQSRVEGWYDSVLKMDSVAAKEAARNFLHLAMKSPTPLAYQVASEMSLWRGQWNKAVEEAERAVAVGPNNADSLVSLAKVLVAVGRPVEAIEAINHARRLDPHNEGYHFYVLGQAQFGMNQFQAAAASVERALELEPDYLSPADFLVPTYAHLGRTHDTQTALEILKQGWSQDVKVSIVVYWYPYKETADAERLADGLRKAGLPE